MATHEQVINIENVIPSTSEVFTGLYLADANKRILSIELSELDQTLLKLSMAGFTGDFFEFWKEVSRSLDITPLELMRSLVTLADGLHFNPAVTQIKYGSMVVQKVDILSNLEKIMERKKFVPRDNIDQRPLSITNLMDIKLSRSVAEKFIAAFMTAYESDRGLDITPREVDVIECAMNGMSGGEIAGKLRISEQTAKNHMTHILRKMDMNGRLDVALTGVHWMLDIALQTEI